MVQTHVSCSSMGSSAVSGGSLRSGAGLQGRPLAGRPPPWLHRGGGRPPPPVVVRASQDEGKPSTSSSETANKRDNKPIYLTETMIQQLITRPAENQASPTAASLLVVPRGGAAGDRMVVRASQDEDTPGTSSSRTATKQDNKPVYLTETMIQRLITRPAEDRAPPTAASLRRKRPPGAVAWDQFLDSVADIGRHLQRGVEGLPSTQAINRLNRLVRGEGGRLRLEAKKPVVLVLGSGWAAHSLIKVIDHEIYDVVVVSPSNAFLFTPMLTSRWVGRRQWCHSSRQALHPAGAAPRAGADWVLHAPTRCCCHMCAECMGVVDLFSPSPMQCGWHCGVPVVDRGHPRGQPVSPGLGLGLSRAWAEACTAFNWWSALVSRLELPHPGKPA